MHLLADENLPRPSIQLLREAGHDVDAVGEFGAGMPDTEVLAHAQAGDRIILTFDRDSGELFYRRGGPVPAGVVYLKFVPASPDEPGRILLQLLSTEGIDLAGRFTVVERDRVRQRPLLRTI